MVSGAETQPDKMKKKITASLYILPMRTSFTEDAVPYSLFLRFPQDKRLSGVPIIFFCILENFV